MSISKNGELKLCKSGETSTPACCPDCFLCIGVLGYCLPAGGFLDGVDVVVTGPDGLPFGQCKTAGSSSPYYYTGAFCLPPGKLTGFGCCCIPFTDAGQYTVTVSKKNYKSQSVTIDLKCELSASAGVSFSLQPTDLTPDDPAEYVDNHCCPCAPHGDQPNRPPRKVFATLEGPTEILGAYDGSRQGLTLADDSDDGTGWPDPRKFLHWTSGCLANGGYGYCYQSWPCQTAVRPGDCSQIFPRNLPLAVKKIGYQSCRIDLYQFYGDPFNPLQGCYTLLTFTNYWQGGCKDDPLPDCQDRRLTLNTAPYCVIDCPCGKLPGSLAPDGRFYGSTFNKSISIYALGLDSFPPFTPPGKPIAFPVLSAICRRDTAYVAETERTVAEPCLVGGLQPAPRVKATVEAGGT